jgi:hypothetical protein
MQVSKKEGFNVNNNKCNGVTLFEVELKDGRINVLFPKELCEKVDMENLITKEEVKRVEQFTIGVLEKIIPELKQMSL